MYIIIKNVIESGNFELADMLRKLDKLWIQDSIAEEQRDELITLAREKAHMDRGYADQEERFRRIEERLAALEEFDRTQTDTPEQMEEYPAWVQPTGAHDAYYFDHNSKMTYPDGKRYICIAPEGYAVTYGPDILPGYWQVQE